MISVPPVVVHARKIKAKARFASVGLLASALVGCVLVAPVVGWLSPLWGVLLAVVWSALLSVVLGRGARHIASTTAWVEPVLASFASSELTSRVEYELDQWGDITGEQDRTLASIRRLCLRIEGLAADRQWICEAVTTARMAAGTLAAERRALTRFDVRDGRFQDARASMDAQLDTLCGRLLALLEALVEQAAVGGSAAVADALSHVSAEAEVAHPSQAPLRIARGLS
jgi:hypothetical protein